MRHFVVLPILLLIFPSFVCVSMAGEGVTSSNLSSILHEFDTTADHEKKIKLMVDINDALSASNITFNVDIQNALIRALDDKDSSVRWHAAYLLGVHTEDISVIPFLQKVVDTDPEPEPASRAKSAIDYIKLREYERSRPFEKVKADIYSEFRYSREKALNTLFRYHQNDPRTMDTIMEIMRSQNDNSDLQTYIIENFWRSDSFKNYQSELYQISYSLLLDKDLPLDYRKRILSFIKNNTDFLAINYFSDLLKIINDSQEDLEMRQLTIDVLDKLIKFDPSSVELFKKAKRQFKKDWEIHLDALMSLDARDSGESSNTQAIKNEEGEDEKKSMDKNPPVPKERITKEAMLSCIGGLTGASESHFRKMAKNAFAITERLESSSPTDN